MKKFISVITAFCLAAVLIGCISSIPAAYRGMPKAIANARRNVPDDVLVGIGSVKMLTVTQYRNIAAMRARVEILNAMNSMVKDMVRDYTASSEVDPAAIQAYQENITATISRSNLSGAVIHFEESGRDDIWWVVMYLSKANVVREISQAAGLAVPDMPSFDTEARMNAAFDKVKAENW